MNKRFLTTAAAILLVGASAFSALTFTGCSCTGKGNKTQTTTAASAVQAKTYETKDYLIIYEVKGFNNFGQSLY